jgi:serine/threonine protein kinase
MAFSVVGDYRINHDIVLGKGGFGEVLKGEDIETKEPVAAKRIVFDGSEKERASIMTEVNNLEKARGHPNVLQLLHHEEIGNVIWVITEFCDENHLSNFAKTRSLDLKQKCDIMHQCASALAYMNELNIVHRDIKPDNILVSMEDGRPVVKMADFGLSKAFADNTSVLMSTIAGTPFYWAPEQFAFPRPQYNKTVDTFSLGVIYLYLLRAKDGKGLDEDEGKHTRTV